MRQLGKTAVVAASLVLAATTAGADEFIRMVSGPAGGSWYPLSAKISEVLGKQVPGIATSSGPGGGVGNLLDVNKREAEIGWSYAHTSYNGFTGKGKFNKAQDNIRHLATLYPAAVQTAVPRDSSIKSYADLQGKNISPGLAKWSGYAAAELLLGYYGITMDGIKSAGGTVHHVSYSDSVGLMKDGHIDAFIAMTSVPQASFIDLNFNPGVRFLGVEPEVLSKFMTDNPGYIKTVIPATAYENMDADVPTLGVVTILVVNKDVPDDIVYNITRTLWGNHDEFAKVKKVWNDVKLENALLGAAVPVHPGAQRYYDEQGVKKK